MSSDKKQIDNNKGYSTPSIAADLFATFVGLALVYGMITLVGNGKQTRHLVATPPATQMNADKSALKTYKISPNADQPGTAAATRAVDLGHIRKRAQGKLAAFSIYKTPKKLPAFGYVDEQGGKHSLAELRGKVVLLNLWATWCGPCRHEMPWLDDLKARFAGRPFEMLTISVDRGGLEKPRHFFNKIKVKNLTLYGDKTGRLGPLLRAFGLPATILIDRQGRELGRIAGPAEWASGDAHAFIEAAISATAGQI